MWVCGCLWVYVCMCVFQINVTFDYSYSICLSETKESHTDRRTEGEEHEKARESEVNLETGRKIEV